MITYIFVLIGILIFFGLAQQLDCCEVNFEKGSVKHSKTSNWMFAFRTLILIVVAGLRYRVGTDFGAYYLGLERYSNELLKSITELDEPGIRLLARITSWFTKDGAVFIFVCAFVTLALIGYKLLGYPPKWIIKSFITMLLKSITPIFLLKYIETFKGNKNDKVLANKYFVLK